MESKQSCHTRSKAFEISRVYSEKNLNQAASKP